MVQTSRVERKTDEDNRDTIGDFNGSIEVSKYNSRQALKMLSLTLRLSLTDKKQTKIEIKHRRGKKNAVDSVEHAAVTR